MVLVIGGVNVKIKSLSFKILVYYLLLILSLLFIMLFQLKSTFDNYYYDEIFNLLTSHSEVSDIISVSSRSIDNENTNKIEVLTWVELNGKLKLQVNKTSLSRVSLEIINRIESNVKKQIVDKDKYILKVNDTELFYVINKKGKVIINGNDKLKYYNVALKWYEGDRNLRNQLLNKMLTVSLIAFLCTMLVAAYISKIVSKPLVLLNDSVMNIANRKMDHKIEVTGDDEISQLGMSIEKMRMELIEYEENEKFKIHSISHELKTPIMVIKSYSEGFRQDVFPLGSKEKTVDLIQLECDKMEKLIKDFLTIQKLDYILSKESKISCEQINVGETIDKLCVLYQASEGEIEIVNNIKNLYINAKSEHVKTIFENIISNQFRFAKKNIVFESYAKDNQIRIVISNDGEKLKKVETIFQAFEKGENGKSGLGLYITKRIVELYGGNITACNSETGVSFIITLPIEV